MVEQLTMINLKVDNRKSYKADGVICSNKMNDLEVLLIETAGSFQSKDERKISFDNIKGMFALLAMAKSIVDYFSHASVETFGKLKLYYVQASDEYLRLWSIQYISNGIYKYNREDKLKIRVDEPHQTAKELVDFFNAVKASLVETFDLMLQLKLEDEENKDANSQQTLLSDIICPKIFRLTYKRHGKGFKGNTINSSPESN